MIRTTALATTCALASFMTGCTQDPSFAIFDGRSLDGWHDVGGGTWTVTEEGLLGTASRQNRSHGLLVTDARYTDFIATFEYRLTSGDSGFYFRVEETATDVGVVGYQVEVDDVEPGGLYETGGRAWVVKHTAEQAAAWHRSGEWNAVRLRAVGSHLQVWVNGMQTVDLDDPECRREGPFALQLHGGQDMYVEYRNIAVEPLHAK